jgi:hypothetical protein
MVAPWKPPVEKTVAPVDEDRHPANKADQSAPIGGFIQADPGVPSNPDHETKRHKRDGLHWARFGMEVIALGLLGWGSSVAYRSLGELSNQTTALTQQTYRGQRAYLLIENLRLKKDNRICAVPTMLDDLNVALGVGTPMWLQWDIKNTGQTPAHNIQVFGDFQIGPAAPPLNVDIPIAMQWQRVGSALGPNECEPSPDAPFMWLGRNGYRPWNESDKERTTGTPPKERLWAVVYVVYDTIFSGIRGYSSVCGYYEGSRFTPCGTVMR